MLSITEQVNPATMDIDVKNGAEIAKLINDEDKKGQVGSIGLRYDEYIEDIVATCQYQKQQIEELQKELKELKG